MYHISEQQVEFILDDISARGIETEDLQLNLLDHICCIIEQELEENGDFGRFYQATIKRFYKTQLREIEDEAISLLINQNYYAMKKIMIVSGVFSAALFIMGIVLKFMHAPGASFGIVAGVLIMSLVFLPLVFLLKVKEQKQLKDKFLAATGTVSAILMSLSVLFRVMHWPYSIELGYATIGILALLFLPVYVTNGIRQPETKVNTAVTAILLVGVCCLWLTMVVSPVGMKINMIQETSNVVRNEMILRAEQQSTAISTSNDLARSINSSCEELKAFLLQRSSGHNTIGADFEEKEVLIRSTWLASCIDNSPEMEAKLKELKTMVANYNAKAAPALHKIPVAHTILDMSTERVSDALNSLVQIQMYVLQNERSLAIK
jgi:hypothetical protein